MQAYAAHPSQPNLSRGSPTSFFKVSIAQNNEIQGVYSCSVKSIYSANCSGTVECTHSINSYTEKNFTLSIMSGNHIPRGSYWHHTLTGFLIGSGLSRMSNLRTSSVNKSIALTTFACRAANILAIRWTGEQVLWGILGGTHQQFPGCTARFFIS